MVLLMANWLQIHRPWTILESCRTIRKRPKWQMTPRQFSQSWWASKMVSKYAGLRQRRHRHQSKNKRRSSNLLHQYTILHLFIHWMIALLRSQEKRNSSSSSPRSWPRRQPCRRIAVRASTAPEERGEIGRLAMSWEVATRAWSSSQQH